MRIYFIFLGYTLFYKIQYIVKIDTDDLYRLIYENLLIDMINNAETSSNTNLIGKHKINLIKLSVK